MLDIKWIRENVSQTKGMLIARRLEYEVSKIDALLEIDKEKRSLIATSDTLKAKRNQTSEEISVLKKNKQDATTLITEMKVVSDTIAKHDEKLRELEIQEKDILLYIPNKLHESVPIGKTAEENVVYKERMEFLRPTDFERKDHFELGTNLKLFDFKRSAKISGAGFPFYTGKGATLERALINFMLDLHLEKHGCTEMFPPFLVNEESLQGTGQFPKFRDQVYAVNEYDLFTIPTAEVPITNFYRDEILSMKELPKYFVGYSACFRSEAGSYGKDVKGLLRLHQFNKVELVKFVPPEDSYTALERLLQDAEDILLALELPYRVLTLCSGDTGAGAAKCYDIEVWSPAEKRFLEVSSCSNFEDFQARRANIRFRREEKSKPEFIHTLNGSGLATPRLLVAILEHYQTNDGKLNIPKVLQPYMKIDVIE